MRLDAELELLAGSVTGRDHTASGRNNQDAWCVRLRPEAAVAVVCDGCGSGRHSEVGAWLGVRLVVGALERLRDTSDLAHERAEALLARVADDVLARLRAQLESLGLKDPGFVHEHFLFTVVGAWVTPRRTLLFSLGDGLVALNGEVTCHTAPENAPDYLGHALLGVPRRFRVDADVPTDTLESLLVATDGAGALREAEGRCLPGSSERVPAFEQLWIDDRLFRNPQALSRRLALTNREAWRTDPLTSERRREHGLLPDDTTVAVIRRRRS